MRLKGEGRYVARVLQNECVLGRPVPSAACLLGGDGVERKAIQVAVGSHHRPASGCRGNGGWPNTDHQQEETKRDGQGGNSPAVHEPYSCSLPDLYHSQEAGRD